ncbi:MAG: N-acetylmuramoyl-L-alanine amidase [Dysgonamonadaceae bacterium]|jgi:N-acetylmuramoyl-L-alanine amidase|nr:N-acetylmuramoyl-L-alanine amidase [Dysgonamonadaceae bacterium]
MVYIIPNPLKGVFQNCKPKAKPSARALRPPGREVRNILLLLAVLLFTFPMQAGADTPPFVLVIDPGHGGKAAGAVGKKGKEKDINLAVSKLLRQYIYEAHPDVAIIMTRDRDVNVDLDERADMANKANANLFISIHANSVARRRSSSHINGSEVYTFGLSRNEENLEVAKRENSVILLEENYEQKYEGFDPNSSESYIIFEFMQNKFVEQSVDFATMVQRQLVETAHRKDLGVKQAEFLVLRKSTMPRVLVELDFISNPEAEQFMLSKEGQEVLARSICNAFTEYKTAFDRTTERKNSKR